VCGVTNITRRLSQASLILLLAGTSTVARAQTTSQPAHQPGQTASSSSSSDESFSIWGMKSHTVDESYDPITAKERFYWFVDSTISPVHLLGGGIISAGIGTGLDHPREYGPSWGGFGDRFGMRLTGISTGNAMEAFGGAVFGEDPRYFREPDKGIGGRVENVIKQTFMARRRDGSFGPAYARYVAESGNNFLSNLWRVHSEAGNEDALARIGEGFGGKMASNAWEEFWPTISSHFHHH
jgi:hypothetical protein